jgi:hypothetical protein
MKGVVVMPSNPISRFQLKYMSYGSWISEWFYGFIMVAMVSGMITGYSFLGLHFLRWEITLWLIVVTFGVNISWGLIDGLSVVYGGLVDKADEERLIGNLKKDKSNPKFRETLLGSIGDSVAGYVSDEDQEGLADKIIDQGPEAKKKYHFTKEDRNIVLATASCDVLAVIPVILPYIILGFTSLAFTLSVLIASIAMAYIVFIYAKRTGRRKWMAASIFFVFALIMTLLAYYYGW